MQFIEHPRELSAFLDQHSVVLCDQNTAEYCYPLLPLELPLIVIPAGERSKNLDSCQAVWSKLMELGADRQSRLICLGGGMICDLGAFCASVYQRGIEFSLLPTSLLAMVDAAIGGKNGVDFLEHKNYLGLFSQNQNTIICADFLESLPREQWVNGYAEMLKHGLIYDKDHFQDCLRQKEGSLPGLNLINRSIEIKLKHTERDFKELGIRKRLNFGHTIGHAIESLSFKSQTQIEHGMAVLWGMLGEAYLSHKYWSLSKDDLQQIENGIKPLLKQHENIDLNFHALYKLMLKDKKNLRDQVQFALLNSLGSAQENLPLQAEQIESGIRYLARFK